MIEKLSLHVVRNGYQDLKGSFDVIYLLLLREASQLSVGNYNYERETIAGYALAESTYLSRRERLLHHRVRDYDP